MQSYLLEDEHKMFQEAVRDFVDKEIVPHHRDWEEKGMVSRDLWLKAGEQGLLCMDFPEEYGGMGFKDYRYNALFAKELSRAGATGPGFFLHNDIVAPYFLELCNEAQRAKYMPSLVNGSCISAIAITEPGAGSDSSNIKTTAIKRNGCYVINGSKTFISNGYLSDVVIVVAKTNPMLKHNGVSLLLVERGMEGFKRGKRLEKLGMKAQDTAELFFEDVEVPEENLLGEEGMGFHYMMYNLSQERLSIAVIGLTAAESALEWTMQYCRERMAFGKKIGDFQNSRFKLAEMKTELTIARTFVDQCIMELNEDKLTAEKAAMAKYWVTDLQCKVMDQCLQLHGGYGYIKDFPIANAYIDARIQRIYGGTNEIMKEIIGRSMGFSEPV